jgi:hypothetical protein
MAISHRPRYNRRDDRKSMNRPNSVEETVATIATTKL